MRGNSAVFGAIADPTRRAILNLLRDGERSAGELAARFTVSRPAISRHVRVLRTAGLVHERRVAQSRRYALAAEGLADVAQWIDSYRVYWAARLMDLKAHVESLHAAPIANSPPAEGENR